MKTLKPDAALLRRLKEHVQKMSSGPVVVIGDLGLDEYIQGGVKRISPEAPVPVLDVGEVSYRVGLSGNVAQNLRALGAEARLVAAVGVDSTA